MVIFLRGMDKDRPFRRSYKPICIFSVLKKVFERVLVGRLARVLERRRSRAPFGFVKGLGIQDVWIRVKQVVVWSEKSNEKMSKLMEIGCKEIKVWTSYFRDRKVCVVGGANEVGRKVCRDDDG